MIKIDKNHLIIDEVLSHNLNDKLTESVKNFTNSIGSTNDHEQFILTYSEITKNFDIKHKFNDNINIGEYIVSDHFYITEEIFNLSKINPDRLVCSLKVIINEYTTDLTKDLLSKPKYGLSDVEYYIINNIINCGFFSELDLIELSLIKDIDLRKYNYDLNLDHNKHILRQIFQKYNNKELYYFNNLSDHNKKIYFDELLKYTELFLDKDPKNFSHYIVYNLYVNSSYKNEIETMLIRNNVIINRYLSFAQYEEIDMFNGLFGDHFKKELSESSLYIFEDDQSMYNRLIKDDCFSIDIFKSVIIKSPLKFLNLYLNNSFYYFSNDIQLVSSKENKEKLISISELYLSIADNESSKKIYEVLLNLAKNIEVREDC